MNTHCITLLHMAKESHIIVRIEPDFRARLDRLAALERRTVSQLCRNVLEDFVTGQEHTMGLVLRTTPEPNAPHPRKTTEEVKAAILGHQTPQKLRRKRSGNG